MAPRKIFGTTWWGKAWLQALEAIDHSNRLPRGRSYWNTGHVDTLELSPETGRIEATVSGSAYYPYEVSVGMKPIPERSVKLLVDDIARDPDLIAELLEGELPETVAERAEALGIELFPRSSRSLHVSCSCPDGARICKHVAAVVYGVADAIDRDPFLVFKLHGIDLKKALAERGVSIENAVVVKPPTLDAYLANAVEEMPDPKPGGLPGSEAEALEILRTLPLSGLESAPERMLALWPDRHPLSNHADFPGWWRGVQKKLSKSLAKRLEAAARASAGETEDESAPVSNVWEGYVRRQVGLPVPGESVAFGIGRDADGANLTAQFQVTGGARKTPRHIAVERRTFADALLAATSAEARHLPTLIEVWRVLMLTAAHLAAAGALVPVVVEAKPVEKLRRVRRGAPTQTLPVFYWAPALRSSDVADVFGRLVRGLAPFADRLLVEGTLAEGPAGLRRTALLALSWAASAVVESEVARLDLEPSDTAQAYLFGLDLRDLRVPENIPVAALMARYFRPFLMADALPWKPVLTVRKGTDDITMNYGILPRAGERTTPVRLSEILKDPAWADDRFAALSTLKTLARIEPLLEDVRTSGGKPAHLELEHLKSFLFESAPQLRLLGVALRLPESLRKLLKPRLIAHFGSGSEGGQQSVLTKEALSDFEWRVALGDRQLTASDLRGLMEHSGEIVRMGEDFVYLDPDELERMVRLMEAEREPTYLEKMRALLSGQMEGAEVVAAPEIEERIRRMTEVRDVPLPAGLRATLRPYQERGYGWLMKNLELGFGSLIADDMGLGKTLQVIAAVTKLKESGELEKEKVLAVLPTTLITNWTRELAKFSPDLTVGVYHGAARTLPKAADLPDILLTSYGTMRRDVEKLASRRWRLLILDEAQAVKNADSAQTTAARSLKARQVIAMSGTPVENRLLEYWSILSTVQPKLLGTKKDFLSTFAVPIESAHDPKAIEALRRLTAPFMLRRLKTDRSIISDLPEKNVSDRFTTLTPEQTALYAKTLEELIDGIDRLEKKAKEDGEDVKMKRRGLVLKLITSLKQICNSPSQYLKKDASEPDSGKAEALLDLLTECRAAERKVLVFTQFREMGERLQTWIERSTGKRPDFLHGGVSVKERTAMVDRFQTDRSVDVMIISLKAGGTGLNLTEASAVIHYDLWWNPAVEAQATDRAYRIGQRRDVLVYRFVTAGTFEEKINRMLEEKRNLADMTVTTGETWIGDMDRSEIESIFRLTPEESS